MLWGPLDPRLGTTLPLLFQTEEATMNDDTNTRSSLADIQEFLDFCGPAFEVKPVTIGQTLDKEGNPVPHSGKTRNFCFKKLNSLDADFLRTYALNEKGQVDRERFKGASARTVAATLVDINTHAPFASVEEIEMWPAPMVDALAKAANEVNGMHKTAVEDEVGNSKETPSDGSSST